MSNPNKAGRPPGTIIVRKKLRALKDLSDSERYQIIQEYKSNTSVHKIAIKFHLPDKTVQNFINKEYKEFVTSKETHHLYSGHELYDNLTRPKDVNEEFLEIVEEGGGLSYAWFYAMTNDNSLALEQSKLDTGLLKTGAIATNAKRLRGLYLRSVPEVRKEIERIRMDLLRDNPVTKDLLQSELITQIQEMKELVTDEPRQRGTLLKAIEMLGKSIGAFSESIKVEHVNADEALDTLIEMSKSTYEDLDDEE